MKKAMTIICLILAVGMVLFFTFQDAEGTTSLSEAVRHWLENHGVKMEPHALRSNIHILEYSILGLAVLVFGYYRGWKIGRCVLICCLIGVLDEGIKVFLPTREFDVVDLVKDWVGIGLGTAAVWMLTKERK